RDLAPQLGDPLADPPAVGLELGLTGTTQTHTAVAARSAAGLPGQRRTPAAQPGNQVLQLSELDLRLALLRPGMLGEDVEDERGPVDDLDLQLLLELAQLARRQFTVADDGVRARGGHDVEQFAYLPRTHVRGRVGPVAALDNAFQHGGTGGLGKPGELLERGLG